jgi:uracil-DNA glycosylase
MLQSFFAALTRSPSGSVFNPWVHRDATHDQHPLAPQIRQQQLQAYLQERLHSARYLLIAEALGYQGGHFSGIPMTSERLLLGKLAHKGLYPTQVFQSIRPQRTSLESVRRDGFTEPTATIVWGELVQHDPYAFVLWNAFPWHPYKSEKGLLSNRTPTPIERRHGQGILEQMLALFPHTQLIAIGEQAAAQLHELQRPHHKVRHPANGGAGRFREQLRALLPSDRSQTQH